MFTPSTTSTTSAFESDRTPAALFPLPPPHGSPRRLHVNDSNPQCWHVVTPKRGLMPAYLEIWILQTSLDSPVTVVGRGLR